MKRQQFLLIVLAFVAVTMLPVYFVDQQRAALEKEQAALQEQIALQREKVDAVRRLEAELAQEEQAMSDLDQRLIDSGDPFAAMEREIASVAARAGLRVIELNLSGAEALEQVPTVQRYSAKVELSGSVGGFIEFIRLLEAHRLLIEIPDLDLGFGTGATTVTPVAGQAAPPFVTRIELHFFGKVPGDK